MEEQISTSAEPREGHSLLEHPNTIFATLIAIAVTGAVLVLAKWSAGILTPMLLAFFLATLGRPFFRWLQNKGWGRGWALLGVVLILAVSGGVLLLLAWLYVDRLVSGLAMYQEQLKSRFGVTATDVGQQASNAASQITLSSGMSSALVTIVGAIAGAISQLVIAFVLAIMLLIEWPRFSRIVRRVGNSQPFLSKLPVVAKTAVTYITVRAKINLMTGVVFGIAIALVGVDYAILWGVVTFFLSFIPYVGIVLAAAAPALLGLAETGWWVFWYVIIAVTVINLTVENVVAPTMTGKSLSLSPAVVFVMFFFWTWLLGPVGMLISMPITVLLMLVFASDPSTMFLAQLLGSEEPPAVTAQPEALPAAIAAVDGD